MFGGHRIEVVTRGMTILRHTSVVVTPTKDPLTRFRLTLRDSFFQFSFDILDRPDISNRVRVKVDY